MHDVVGCLKNTGYGCAFRMVSLLGVPQVQDFQQILYERPAETLACLGLALCLARKALLQTSGEACAMNKIAARFVNVEPVIPMASLKSSTVAKFVSLRATVVRCSAIRPLVLRAEFECSKCGTSLLLMLTRCVWR